MKVSKLNPSEHVEDQSNKHLLKNKYTYSPSSKICKRYLKDKYFIIHMPDMSSMYKRNDLTNACRHRKESIAQL